MRLTLNAKFLILIAAVLAAFAFATVVHANPFYVASTAKSATATTTQTYLRTGNATSTTIYDAYEIYGTNQTNQANVTLPDTLAWELFGTASSTSSVVNAWCEYSDNYNGTTGNGDWYQNDLLASTSTNAGVQNISQQNSFTMPYASTTVGGAALSGSDNRFQKIITCPVYTRFTRLIVTNTGAGASVWVQAIPKKQRNSGM